jgi:ribosomal protein S18 acetylase RimI-like enzyme
MSCSDLRFEVNRAGAEEIAAHLERCDASFHPPLSSSVCLRSYAEKIRRRGVTFEAWAGETLVGLVAVYFNDRAVGEGFITNVSVEEAWAGRKIATALLSRSLGWGRAHDYPKVRLEVQKANAAAIGLYESLGFHAVGHKDDLLAMVWSAA